MQTRNNSFTVRAEGGNGEPLRLVGRGVPFGVSTPMPVYFGMREIIQPGAFPLPSENGNNAEPVFLFANHDSNQVLGRTGKNLRIWEEPEGIHYICDPLPDTQYARDTWTKIRDGLTPDNSFGFEDIKRETKQIEGESISVLTVGRLRELSVAVPFAANPSTTFSEARNMGTKNKTNNQEPQEVRALDADQQAAFDSLGAKVDELLTIAKEDQTMDQTETASPEASPPMEASAPTRGESPEPAYFKRLSDKVESLLSAYQANAAGSQKRAIARNFPLGETDINNRDRSFGGFLLAVRNRDQRTLERTYQSRLMTGATGGQGGFLIPPEFVAELYKVDAEAAIVRPRAANLPMGSRTKQIPYLDQYSTPSAGTSAFLGGVAATWTEEGKTLAEQTPNLKQLELTAHELSGYTSVANSTMADSAIGLDALLIELFGQSIRWYEEYAFLLGDGVGKPLGAFAPANSAVTVAVTRNTASTFKYADAVKMVSKLLPGSTPQNTCWVMSITAMEQYLQLSDAGGNNIVLIPNVLGGGATQGFNYSLLNFPIVFTEKLPALGSARDVCLGNFSKYVIGDRQTPSIDFSEHAEFKNNNSVWRFVLRMDGRPWMKSSITLADGTNKVSPFVYLS